MHFSFRLFWIVWLVLNGSFFSHAQSWVAKNRVKSADFQQVFDELTPLGLEPQDLSAVRDANGNTYFSSVWVKAIAGNWDARFGHTGKDFQEYMNRMSAQKYAPVEVLGYNTGGEVRFASVWKQMPSTWQVFFGLNATELQAKFDALTPKGYMPTKISAYKENGITRFVGIWVYAPTQAWQARYSMSASDFQSNFDTFTPQGYVPIDIYAYEENGQLRYGAIWQKLNGVIWDARYGFTESKYQSYFDDLGKKGYRPYILCHYNIDGIIYYAAAWKK